MKTENYSYLLDVRLNQLLNLIESSTNDQYTFTKDSTTENQQKWDKKRTSLKNKDISSKKKLAGFIYGLFKPSVEEINITITKKRGVNQVLESLFNGKVPSQISALIKQDTNHDISDIESIIDKLNTTSSISKSLSNMSEIGSLRKVSSKEVVSNINKLIDIGNNFVSIESLFEAEEWEDDDDEDDEDYYPDLTKYAIPEVDDTESQVFEIDESINNINFEDIEEVETKRETINIKDVLYNKKHTTKVISYLEGFLDSVKEFNTIPYGYGVLLFCLSTAIILKKVFKDEPEKIKDLDGIYDFFEYVKKKRTYVGEISASVKWLIRFNNLGLFKGNDFFNVDQDAIIKDVETAIGHFENSSSLWDGHKKEKKQKDIKKILKKAGE